MRIVHTLASRLDLPVVPHFMDAWPQTLFADGELLGLGRLQVGRSLRRVLSRSPRILAISAAMAREYGTHFGIPASVFMNCVTDAEMAAATTAPPESEDLVFAYVGGLHLDRWRSLAGLAIALKDAAPQARLKVHAPQAHLDAHAKAFASAENVDWGPALEPTQVSKSLAAAHVLVHVESFEPAARDYTRLSISTKIPQYMAARRPILAIGPGELASMRHIEEARAGTVVPSMAASDIADIIRPLASDPALRKTQARRGRAYAEAHHSRSAVSAAFAARLQEVAALHRH
jgi:hypothetical protein